MFLFVLNMKGPEDRGLEALFPGKCQGPYMAGVGKMAGRGRMACHVRRIRAVFTASAGNGTGGKRLENVRSGVVSCSAADRRTSSSSLV